MLPIADHDPGDLAHGTVICVWNEIPKYILPRPWVVLQTLYTDAPLLFGSLLVTLRITFLGLALAVIGGVGLAVLFAQSKWVEMSFFPFAIVLQVTPIVAIFPLINIYVDNQTAKLLLCAWIVAFFPILSNTTLGPELGRPQSARPVQAQRRDAMAAALASEAAGGDAVFPRRAEDRRRPVADRRRRRRIRGGRAGQSSGLASRIIEAGYRLNAPRLFAALILISITGILIFLVLTLVSHLILRRWHESALKQER